MRYSDRPISRPSEDVLGRSGFALELARAIDRLVVAKDGFVIGIIGEWGSGKSSVVELIIRYLRHIEMARMSGTSFSEAPPNPKTLAELEEMSGVFEVVEPHILALEAANKNVTYWQRLNQLNEFRRWLDSEESARIANEYWRIKLSVDQRPHTIVLRFSPWLIAGRAELAVALISELARSLGEHLGDEVKQAFAGILARLSELAPIAGLGLDLISAGTAGKIFSLGGSWSKKLADELATGPTLDELRERLRAVLRNLDGQQVLVVVDDLDRLTPPEALEMVSLVKSLGDLPNVIYLLSYDERKLAGLLELAIGVDGNDYLEKIVQYPVHLPILAEADLIRLLDADLIAIWGTLSPASASRLGSTWYFIFRHYFHTPRDIRRFTNSISVAHSALAGHTDPIDLIFLELLRLYEPDLYWWLRRNLDLFVE